MHVSSVAGGATDGVRWCTGADMEKSYVAGAVYVERGRKGVVPSSQWHGTTYKLWRFNFCYVEGVNVGS